jgi:uncharacterized protein (DUF2225 family)
MADIDWDFELEKIRELKGKKTTDFMRLTEVVLYAVAQCPKSHLNAFQNEYREIQLRVEMLTRFRLIA